VSAIRTSSERIQHALCPGADSGPANGRCGTKIINSTASTHPFSTGSGSSEGGETVQRAIGPKYGSSPEAKGVLGIQAEAIQDIQHPIAICALQLKDRPGTTPFCRCPIEVACSIESETSVGLVSVVLAGEGKLQ
jgi:hypothetical protein